MAIHEEALAGNWKVHLSPLSKTPRGQGKRQKLSRSEEPSSDPTARPLLSTAFDFSRQWRGEGRREGKIHPSLLK